MCVSIIVACARRIVSRVPESGAAEKTKKSTTGAAARRIAPATDIAKKTASRTSRYLSPAPIARATIQQKSETMSVAPTNTAGSFTATYAAMSGERHTAKTAPYTPVAAATNRIRRARCP